VSANVKEARLMHLDGHKSSPNRRDFVLDMYDELNTKVQEATQIPKKDDKKHGDKIKSSQS
jgi:hypothetical protein